MTVTETPGNGGKTLSDDAFAAELAGKLDQLLEWCDLRGRQLDHIDEQIHTILQFIDEQRPYLARATALLDPGKAARTFMRGRGKNGHP